MRSIKLKAQTALALGIPNLSRALTYRSGVKLGLNPVRRLTARIPGPPYFEYFQIKRSSGEVAQRGWTDTATMFGCQEFAVSDQPPVWHANPVNGSRVKDPDRHWWEIPDFDAAVGDIKTIWEASRFDWVLAYAQQAAIGQQAALHRLNTWLADWIQQNPPYKGPNWKCGQEASIRVMHLAMAAVVMDQVDTPLSGLLELVELHLQRIAPTIMYAIAQDNNHGTSEAAALFIGGSWLAAHGNRQGKQWSSLGRKWLENRAKRLIERDGSFSQYSLNYHRVMLDTFCMAEVWRQKLDLPRFSDIWYDRSRAATNWLFSMISPENGDGPNLGANDGARLLQLIDTDYRDYRPSVHLAMALFENRRAYESSGTWDIPLQWLGLSMPSSIAARPGNAVFDQGGLAILRRGGATTMLRYPRFRFRPSQADALHLDLWLEGRNLLRDAGTYSYNTDAEWLAYFPGTASHNTVQFDDRDQMPRLSRFLFGNWLKTSAIRPLQETNECVSFGASYVDGEAVFHDRDIKLSDRQLVVQDKIGGFRNKAVLRWRLEPGSWQIDGQRVYNTEQHTLTIHANAPIARIELIDGWESRYYLQKTKIPVLEVEIHEPALITSTYSWA